MSVNQVRTDRARDACEHGIHDDKADAQVGPGKRRTWVKSKPPKGKNEGTENDHRNIVSGHAFGLPCESYLPMRGAYNHSSRKTDNPTHRVDDTGSCEVHRSVTQAPIDSALSQPAPTPYPIRVKTIGQRDPEARREQKFFHAQRSAIAPVGIVAVVSINTIMKKNSTITATSLTAPVKNQPFIPMRPYVNAPVAFPAASTAAPKPQPSLSTDRPGPSEAYQPGGTGPFHQLPQPIAKP